MITKKLILQPAEPVNGYHLKLVQDNLDTSIKSVSNLPILNGNFVTMTFASGDNSVEHGLDRDYQGFIVTMLNDNHNLWLSSASNPRKDKILILHSSGAMTATVYVF